MNEPLNKRLRHILDIHFDPEAGSIYWLEKQQALSLDVRSEIRTVDDLHLLGIMEEQALADRPFRDFVPRRFRDCSDYLLAETAGTLGRPKTAVHWKKEFHNAFVEPFLKASRRCGFPAGGNWLFIGPTGPHIIGQAAQACAQAAGSGDVFRVDFDPRWAKSLVPGSFAAGRYLAHVQQQAIRIIEVQNIDVIFSTPAIMETLAGRLSSSHKEKIRGIHLGGMAASNDFMEGVQKQFHNAVLLSGYGNTLFGMMPELHYDRDTGFDYYPYSDRMAAQIVEDTEDPLDIDLKKTVEYGQRGRIVMHRVDEFQLILNLVERDTAIRIAPLEDAKNDRFILDGIRDPQPILNQSTMPSLGLY